MADLAPDDLKAAVAAGVIDERTAARLTSLAVARGERRARLQADDEPFEFFRGFGEIFVAVGLSLFFGAFYGLSVMTRRFFVADAPALGESVSALQIVEALAPLALGLLMAFGCAHYFCTRRRMILPSVVLAVVSAAYVMTIAARGLAYWTDGYSETNVLIGWSLFGAAGMALFYRLFKLPFALAPLGVFLIFAALGIASAISGDDGFDVGGLPEGLFDLAQSPAHAIAILLCGAVLFVAALRFDMRDPHRLSRHSACAFWLHILAAPAIVNTICLSLYNMGGGLGYALASAAFICVALGAIVIDRRSFLMAGVVYAGLSLGAAVHLATGEEFLTIMLTGLLLGGFITVLGAKWTAARSALMWALPDFPGKERLPPY